MPTDHSKPPHKSVDGEVAKPAAKTETVYCCECGKAVDAAGKCANEQCKYSGEVPECP
jgi:hypothetical protein